MNVQPRMPVHPIEAYVALTEPSLDELMGRYRHAMDRVSDLTVRAGVDEYEVHRHRWLARDAARDGHHTSRWEYHELCRRLLALIEQASQVAGPEDGRFDC